MIDFVWNVLHMNKTLQRIAVTKKQYCYKKHDVILPSAKH